MYKESMDAPKPVQTQAKRVKLFVKHVCAFLGVGILFFAASALLGFGLLAATVVIGIWAVVLILHAAFVFVFGRLFITGQDEEQVRHVLAEETNIVEIARHTVAPAAKDEQQKSKS
ncbi:MAG: hypothetical protein JWM56_459 [Candidatus Peribacteria bacterium]|nr:hypothetical protein [Candidatus Peribacteria bacterium]